MPIFAYWFVIMFVGVALLFWAGLLAWAAHDGLFRASGESVKYRVFDDDPADGID